MIKVECVSCKAPYDLDPKRIPDKGMKMRCPKCGTSFMVSKQGVASGLSAVPAPPPLGAPPPAAGAPPAPAGGVPKGTLLGVAATSAAVPAIAAPKHRTAVGVAPEALAPDKPPAGSLIPPATSGPGVPFKQVAPAPAPPPPSTGNKAAAAKGAFGATMIGTPAVAPKAAPSPPSIDLDLPAPRAAAEEESIDVEIPDDLPAPKPPAEERDLSMSHIQVDDLPSPKGEVDLPAPRPPAAAPKPPPGMPAARAAVPAKPAVAAPTADTGRPVLRPAAEAPGLEVDLPARRPGAPKLEVDLPTAKSGADLPVPRAPAPMAKPTAKPKLGGGGFGDLDLPGVAGVADLPAPRVADLPAARGVADLPGPRGVADLPAPRVADLPARAGGTDLPSPKAGGMAFGDLDLPAPMPDGGGDLPAPLGELPTPKSDESSFADLDLGLPDLPPPAGAGGPVKDAFGDIELPPPKPAANLVPPKAKTVQGMGGGGRAPSKSSNDESSFADIKLGDQDSDLPPSLMGDDESSFDDLNLEPEPSMRPQRPAPPSGTGRAARGPEPVEELEPDAMDLGDEESFDDGDAAFGEEEFQEGEEGGDDGDEEVEFGISGEDGKEMGLPPDLLRKQRGEEFEAKQAQRGRRTVAIVVRLAILLVMLGGGGAALAFTHYGAFGVFYWERFLPEAGDARFARSAIEKAEKIAATDTYGDTRRSLKELGEARAKAGLNRELLTRSLLHHALFIVRYGEDVNVAAHAAAILKRLEERSWEAPGMDLARAADAARRKQWAEVEGPLAAARGQAPSDPYVELIAGETALAQGKLDAADKAFAKALQLGGSTRAQWGLARVALQRSDLEAQAAAINDTLKLSPLHVEARMAEARVLWTQGKEEKAQHLLRVALGLDPTEEDQYLSGSKLAASGGYAMLGYIHEIRGRLSMAREAYKQSLDADPYRVEALLGTGRVLLREKRFADAQANFESALSAATKGGQNSTVLSGRKADAEAKLGIGRALLALQRGAEAKQTLDQLNATLPNDPEVILALGETANLLGNKEDAENQFRKSIELAPKKFDGYLALSQFFFKKGDPGKASEVLNDAANKVEETAEMRRMLGQSELARNKMDSAIHEFERALAMDPQDVDAMFGMSMALRKRGDLDRAEKTLNEIAKRDPGYAGLAEQNGLLLEARGKFDKAVLAYTAALEKDPGDDGLLLRLGAAQVSSSQFDAAEQTLAKYIRDLPNSAEGEYFIGRIAFGRGRTPDALSHFDRAVSLDATKGEFHLYVARASLEMGNLGRTLEEIQAALVADPNLGDAYWVRAEVRMRMGTVRDALSDLNKALKLNPARTDAYAVQGACYDQLRQIPEAMRAYRTALEKEPTRAEWWYKLAQLQADSGERGESETSGKRALELGDKLDPMPYWLPDAYRLAGENAEARGDKTSAIRAYKRYMEIAQTAASDRSEIEKKLKGWGVQLSEDQ